MDYAYEDAPMPPSPGFCVYRLWTDDECIYVGRVGEKGPRSLWARLLEHQRQARWWPEVTRIEVAECADRAASVAEETRQIRALKPKRNEIVNHPPWSNVRKNAQQNYEIRMAALAEYRQRGVHLNGDPRDTREQS